jgi:HlyD family secretion protein
VTQGNLIPFRPGMSASVDIQTRRVNKVMSVPIQAVTVRNKDSLNVGEQRGNTDDRDIEVKNENEEKEFKKTEEKNIEFVFVHDIGEARQAEVKTGIQDNDYIEIVSGVSNGQEIICGPYRAVSKILKDKSKVKVVKKEDLYKTDK